jgi:hypothetical protein
LGDAAFHPALLDIDHLPLEIVILDWRASRKGWGQGGLHPIFGARFCEGLSQQQAINKTIESILTDVKPEAYFCADRKGVVALVCSMMDN